MADELASFLDPLPLIAVLRGITPEEIPEVAATLATHGFRVIEVPLNSPRPLESIRRLAEDFGDRCDRDGRRSLRGGVSRAAAARLTGKRWQTPAQRIESAPTPSKRRVAG